jgi:hypothetical protein
VGLADRSQKCDVVVGDIPVEFDVSGRQTFKFNVPIQIPLNISTAKGETFEIALSFFGP